MAAGGRTTRCTAAWSASDHRPRSDQGGVRNAGALVEEAVRLRLEQPARSVAHIVEMLFARHGVRVPERTLREQLQKRGLTRAELLRDQRTFGRYEAGAPNERWIADLLIGPGCRIPGRDAALVGRLVELRYRPEDLSQLEVWFDDRQFGHAVPSMTGLSVTSATPRTSPPTTGAERHHRFTPRQHQVAPPVTALSPGA